MAMGKSWTVRLKEDRKEDETGEINSWIRKEVKVLLGITKFVR